MMTSSSSSKSSRNLPHMSYVFILFKEQNREHYSTVTVVLFTWPSADGSSPVQCCLHCMFSWRWCWRVSTGCRAVECRAARCRAAGVYQHGHTWHAWQARTCHVPYTTTFIILRLWNASSWQQTAQDEGPRNLSACVRDHNNRGKPVRMFLSTHCCMLLCRPYCTSCPLHTWMGDCLRAGTISVCIM